MKINSKKWALVIVFLVLVLGAYEVYAWKSRVDLDKRLDRELLSATSKEEIKQKFLSHASERQRYKSVFNIFQSKVDLNISSAYDEYDQQRDRTSDPAYDCDLAKENIDIAANKIGIIYDLQDYWGSLPPDDPERLYYEAGLVTWNYQLDEGVLAFIEKCDGDLQINFN